jgi:hypothetical protein
MAHKHLATKVLIVGGLVALLSYFFHPDIGQLSVMINGQPVADPLVHFAAIPTFLVIIGITGALMLLLFLGVGIFLFFGVLFFAFVLCAIIAPYFWPVLVIVFFIIALMAISTNSNKNAE